MEYGTPIIFLREAVTFSDKPGGPATVFLEHVPAIYVADSEPICAVCRELEANHARPKRVHGFDVVIKGITIEVNYPNGKKEIRHNVQQGHKVNCWIEA